MKKTNRKVTQRYIAKMVNIGPDFLNHIIQGRRRCPPALALRLEEVTGISKVTWVWGTPSEIRSAIEEQRGQ